MDDVKKMYAALTALTQRNLQSGYLDRIVDEWGAFCSKIEQVNSALQLESTHGSHLNYLW